MQLALRAARRRNPTERRRSSSTASTRRELLGASVVDVDLRAEAGTVWLIVADNGVGGAEASEGGGLDGIRRRLEPFDGEFALSSPVGGPTIATITVPDRPA